MGLSYPLKTFNIVDSHAGIPISGRVTLQRSADIKWYQLPFQPHPCYRAAVVVKNIQPLSQFYDFNVYFDDLISLLVLKEIEKIATKALKGNKAANLTFKGHFFPNPGAAGSNPAWSTIKIKGLTGIFNWLAPFVFAICSTCD